jgi:hypothetical protein
MRVKPSRWPFGELSMSPVLGVFVPRDSSRVLILNIQLGDDELASGD